MTWGRRRPLPVRPLVRSVSAPQRPNLWHLRQSLRTVEPVATNVRTHGPKVAQELGARRSRAGSEQVVALLGLAYGSRLLRSRLRRLLQLAALRLRSGRVARGWSRTS